MRATTRKGLPLPDITDAYNQNFVVGPPGRTFNITGVVRDTDNAQSNILDGMTEYNQDEVITGRWQFNVPINIQAGIGRRLTNNTGGQRVLGDVVMLDPNNDMAFLQPNAASIISNKIGVVAETIPAGQVGYVAFEAFIQVHVVGGVTRLQYLQSQANSYTAAASTLLSSGSFAIALTTPDANNMVIAHLNIGSSLQGGGTVQGPFLWSVGSNQNAWILDAGPLSSAGIQISPRAIWRANAYDTVNHQRNFIWRARSTTNAGLGILELLSSLDAGGETSILSIDNGGLIAPVGGLDLSGINETIYTFPSTAAADIPNRTRFRARTGQTVVAIWPAADHGNADSALSVWMGAVEPASNSGAYVSLGTAAANNQAVLSTGGQLAGQNNSPALVLAPAGTTRLTVPPTGAVALVGDLQASGNFSAVNGAFSGVLNVTGATGLSSTLTVAGMSSLAALTVTGNASVQGTFSVSGNTQLTSLGVSGNLNVTGQITSGGPVISSGGGYHQAYYFMSNSGTYYFQDGGMYITRSGGEWVASHQLGVPNLRINSGYIGDIGGATLYVTNHLQTAYDITVGRFLTVNNNTTLQYCHVANRLITNGYDVGWSNNFGGNAITSGYFYQRGNGGCRCWDNFDFNFTPANYGNYVVQRDGNGSIWVGSVVAAGYVSVNGGQPIYFNGGGNMWIMWDGQYMSQNGACFQINPGASANAVGQYAQLRVIQGSNCGFSTQINGSAALGGGSQGLHVNAGVNSSGMIVWFTDQNGNTSQYWRGDRYIWINQAPAIGSARSIKRDVKPIGSALTLVKRIRGVNFKYAADYLPDENRVHSGFIAEEVADFLPGLVDKDMDEMHSDGVVRRIPGGLRYTEMIPVLWEAVKELSEQVTALQAQVGKS